MMLRRIRNFLSGDSQRRDTIEGLGQMVIDLNKENSDLRREVEDVTQQRDNALRALACATTSLQNAEIAMEREKCGADVPATSLVHLAVRSTCVDCLTRARDDAEDVMRDAQEHYASIVDTLFRLSLAQLAERRADG